MKLLIKLLLSLCFLLSGGYGTLYAHANNGDTTPIALKTVGKFIYNGSVHIQGFRSATLQSALFYVEQGSVQIIATENEDEDDEELNFLRKASSVCRHFFSYLNKQHISCYIQNTLPSLSLGKDFSFLSSCRYIALCVMRI